MGDARGKRHTVRGRGSRTTALGCYPARSTVRERTEAMACPVHIWAPLMAAAVPFAAAARTRVHAAFSRRRSPGASPAPREVHRWAPVSPAAASTPAADGDAPRPQ